MRNKQRDLYLIASVTSGKTWTLCKDRAAVLTMIASLICIDEAFISLYL